MNPLSDNDRQALIKVFEPDSLEATTPITMEDLRQYLIQKIAVLLNRNLDLLFSALYRIDVAERAVKETFSSTPDDQLPEILADLIIERQIQKIRTREAYRE